MITFFMVVRKKDVLQKVLEQRDTRFLIKKLVYLCFKLSLACSIPYLPLSYLSVPSCQIALGSSHMHCCFLLLRLGGISDSPSPICLKLVLWWWNMQGLELGCHCLSPGLTP